MSGSDSMRRYRVVFVVACDPEAVRFPFDVEAASEAEAFRLADAIWLRQLGADQPDCEVVYEVYTHESDGTLKPAPLGLRIRRFAAYETRIAQDRAAGRVHERVGKWRPKLAVPAPPAER